MFYLGKLKEIIKMHPVEKLKKTLALAGINEENWNKLTPDMRQKTFKAKIKKAQLKYHPDRINLDHPDIMPEERLEYEDNIKLLNDVDYTCSTLNLNNSSLLSARPDLEKPEVFFREFKRSVEESIGEGKRFKNWQNAYEYYFEPKSSFRGYRHKIEQHPVDYQEEFNKGLVKGIYKEFVVPGTYDSFGAGADYLPPAFRDEEALLIKICAYQRHTGFEAPPVVSAASERLKLKESFWRAAIAANPKSALELGSLSSLEKKEVDDLLEKKEGPVLEPLSQRLLNDAELMASVIQRYPSFVASIGDRLADDETLLLSVVNEEPLGTLLRASNRLRNVMEPLVEKALLADIYAIEYVVVDPHNSTQMQAYRGWVEQAWKDLRQNEDKSLTLGARPKSREHFVTLLQPPFQDEAKNLFYVTARVIENVKTFIENTEKSLDNSTPGLTGAYNFFAYKLSNKAEPRKQLEAARCFLHQLENKPLGGLAGLSGQSRKSMSSEQFDILAYTTLKTSIDEWKQLSDMMFNNKDSEYGINLRN